MPRVNFIDYKRNRILYLDFSECTIEEGSRTMEEARLVIDAQPPASVLVLSNVTRAQYNRETIKKLQEFVLQNRPFVKASAVIGLDGLKKVIFDLITKVAGRHMSVFATKEDAIAWLAQQ